LLIHILMKCREYTTYLRVRTDAPHACQYQHLQERLAAANMHERKYIRGCKPLLQAWITAVLAARW
jgi:hypothetical protein